MVLQVRQILSRARQGTTRPFLCEADDGECYYVKGRCAGWGSHVSEWVAGHMARRLELPIADFRLMEVDEDLLRYSALEDKKDLGVGVWFASRVVPQAEDLSWQQSLLVPRSLQAQVLLFDWWVTNGDRSLTHRGGNQNLLWTPLDQRLHLIDHNLAFDDCRIDEYMRGHVFRAAASAWDEAFQEVQAPRLEAAARELDRIWAEMPAEWTERDCDVQLEHVRNLLWRFQQSPSTFWVLP